MPSRWRRRTLVGALVTLLLVTAALVTYLRRPKSVWRPATVTLDPSCPRGCETLVDTVPGHGGRVVLRYDPSVDDAIAQWGDCLQDVIACLKEKRPADTCVGAARCPDSCKQRFASAAAEGADEEARIKLFQDMFVEPEGACTATKSDVR